MVFVIILMSGTPVTIPNTVLRLDNLTIRDAVTSTCHTVAGLYYFGGNMLKYKKIAVIGCSGGGKTTFSKKLAEITGLPLYHLDNIYWHPDTSHLERTAFIKKQKEIMKTDRWIIDGNYGGTMKYRIKKCELLYFFDIPTEVCIEGVLNRDRKREDIACELEPDDELLDFIKAYREHSRPKVLKLIGEYPDKKVITFTNHKEVNEYLEELRRCYGFTV